MSRTPPPGSPATRDPQRSPYPDELAALRRLEAAAREAKLQMDIADFEVDDLPAWDAARKGLRAALAALDAIRHPDDGKRGGARL